jgi:hypothetical protein
VIITALRDFDDIAKDRHASARRSEQLDRRARQPAVAGIDSRASLAQQATGRA